MAHSFEGRAKKGSALRAEQIGEIVTSSQPLGGHGFALDERGRVNYQLIKDAAATGDILQYTVDATSGVGGWAPTNTGGAEEGDIMVYRGGVWSDSAISSPADGDMIRYDSASTNWVNTTMPSSERRVATASAAYTLTTSDAVVTGCSVAMTQTGIYHVTATCDFNITATGTGLCTAVVRETVAGVDGAGRMSLGDGATVIRATVSQNYIFTISALPATLAIRASKAIGAGTAQAMNTHTILVAVKIDEV